MELKILTKEENGKGNGVTVLKVRGSILRRIDDGVSFIVMTSFV